MIKEMILEDFLRSNNIEVDTWLAANIEWEQLKSIAIDFEKHRHEMEEYAAMVVRLIQHYEGVHSVRWRVKDCEHTMEKIVRKRAENSDKYKDIDEKNYYSIITDLIGIRALHLFKSDAFSIDSSIRDNFSITEKPMLYLRDGDIFSQEVFSEAKFDHKFHPKGYRSIHYIIKAQPNKRELLSEIQVRTIFEEGWSEIDHRVRYPSFSSDENISGFLSIFNSLAGQADAMGSFVQTLAEATVKNKTALNAAHEKNNQSLKAVEELVSELSREAEAHNQSKQTVEKLKNEVSKMRAASNIEESRKKLGMSIRFPTELFDNIKRQNKALNSVAIEDFSKQMEVIGKAFLKSKEVDELMKAAISQQNSEKAIAEMLKGIVALNKDKKDN